jgi:heme/copper-type cytochrome/quinol oxidase subunit 3
MVASFVFTAFWLAAALHGIHVTIGDGEALLVRDFREDEFRICIL